MEPREAEPGASTTQVRSGVAEIADQWDSLVDRQPLPTPFLKSWWIDNTASGQLSVITVSRAGRLIGGAAFESDRIGTGPSAIERVRCVGQGVLAPDHIDVVYEPGFGQVILAETLAWLRRPGCRVIDLDGLAAEGLLASACRRHQIDKIAAPYARLNEGYNEYLAGRPGKLRSTITRSSKRFSRSGIEFRTAEVNDMSERLERLSELHDARWSEDSKFLTAFDRLSRAALAGATRGEVELHELSGRESTVAMELDLIAGNRVAFYQSGRLTNREQRGGGTVLRAAIIEKAAGSSRLEYDLLRGGEGYKSDWSTDQREVVRCRFGSGAYGRVFSLGANLWFRLAPVLAAIRRSAAESISRAASLSRRESHRESND